MQSGYTALSYYLCVMFTLFISLSSHCMCQGFSAVTQYFINHWQAPHRIWVFYMS